MPITIEPWSQDDLPLLERANTPEMTRYLGGPETPEQVTDRQARYLQSWKTGDAEMYRIEVDGVAAGGIGFWRAEEDGVAAYEAGWSVLPEFQGVGIARESLSLLVDRVREKGDRALLVAYPSVDDAASNALCRGAGFTLRGTRTAPWRGGELTLHVWVLDLEGLDRDGTAG